MFASGTILKRYDEYSLVIAEEFHGVLLVKGRHLVYARTGDGHDVRVLCNVPSASVLPDGSIVSAAKSIPTDQWASPEVSPRFTAVAHAHLNSELEEHRSRRVAGGGHDIQALWERAHAGVVPSLCRLVRLHPRPGDRHRSGATAASAEGASPRHGRVPSRSLMPVAFAPPGCLVEYISFGRKEMVVLPPD